MRCRCEERQQPAGGQRQRYRGDRPIQLGARLFNAYEQEITEFQIVWLSSAPTVATVSAEGLVHGLAEGSTTIRGAVGELEETVTLQVLDPSDFVRPRR